MRVPGETSPATLSSPLQQHTGPNAMHCLHPAGCLGWVGCPLGLRWQPGVFRHSPQEPWLLQDEQNSSVLNNHILGAFLQNRAVTGLGQPVEIQFWHNLVLVSRAPLWAPVMLATAKLWGCGGSPTLCSLLSWERQDLSLLASGSGCFFASRGGGGGPSPGSRGCSHLSPPPSPSHQDASNATCVFWVPGAGKCVHSQDGGTVSSLPT